MTPELAREIIRHGNRTGSDVRAEHITEMFELAEMLLAVATPEDRTLVTGEHVAEFWKDSFNADMEPEV